MKKSILNLGKTLNKKEQEQINGGNGSTCRAGYFNDQETCERGYYPHPEYGAAICCRS